MISSKKDCCITGIGRMKENNLADRLVMPSLESRFYLLDLLVDQNINIFKYLISPKVLPFQFLYLFNFLVDLK